MAVCQALLVDGCSKAHGSRQGGCPAAVLQGGVRLQLLQLGKRGAMLPDQHTWLRLLPLLSMLRLLSLLKLLHAHLLLLQLRRASQQLLWMQHGHWRTHGLPVLGRRHTVDCLPLAIWRQLQLLRPLPPPCHVRKLHLAGLLQPQRQLLLGRQR